MSGQPPTQRLVVRRRFRAPQGRVFQAWTTPDQLKRWWGPMGFTTPDVEVDLRTGGRYRLGMRAPDGGAVAIVGTFVDVEPERRLVYTWSFEGGGLDPEQTLVTVEFLARDEGTEVVLTHERLPTPEVAEHHAVGWGECLQSLADLLEAAT